MRELKFRAWQTVTKVMFSNIERGMGEPHGNPPFADYLENKHMIVMQYTGLHDKHCREVYEGDIVKADTLPQLVEWDERILGWQPYCDYDVDCYGYPKIEEQATWLVIGNIYENPELLTH